jgi:hypothetical protein
VIDRLPRFLLRLEGAVIFLGALALYLERDDPLWLLLVLALAPDLGAIGYVAGPRVGAATYDAVHTLALPVAVGAAGVIVDAGTAVALALIWAIHIGADRALGYGLKYPSGFEDTHLQRV